MNNLSTLEHFYIMSRTRSAQSRVYFQKEGAQRQLISFINVWDLKIGSCDQRPQQNFSLFVQYVAKGIYLSTPQFVSEPTQNAR